MKKFLRLFLYIFAIIGLFFTVLVIISPYNFGSLFSRFLPSFAYLQRQAEPINYDVTTKTYNEDSGEFYLTGNNSFIFDLKDFEIFVQEGAVSYKAFYFNPEFTTVFHPIKYVYADYSKLGEGQKFNCVKILKNVDEQENPDGCKIFTINRGLLGDTLVGDLEYNKLFVYITAFKEGANVVIK